ncbi:hypothetical protein CYMTET_8424 [Cymbomonas tetramitiformis]|uniref:Chromo domain-containing protein n=1 Tax=Cymbomonas tetramitiformis TaxID=36881 RepID=A0AAE0GT97_9CHLO|nr:hypothetical protein CYMTET_8424 [Cymbomonas tetramitiformis]
MGGKRRKTSSTSSSVPIRAQGKGLVKSTPRNAFDPHGSDDNTYTVRETKVEGRRFGKTSWLIGWEGYDGFADSWEPIENLAGHKQDITAFRKREEVRIAEATEATKKRKADAAAAAAAADAAVLA